MDAVSDEFGKLPCREKQPQKKKRDGDVEQLHKAAPSEAVAGECLQTWHQSLSVASESGSHACDTVVIEYYAVSLLTQRRGT